jgi:hypothetical protein
MKRQYLNEIPRSTKRTVRFNNGDGTQNHHASKSTSYLSEEEYREKIQARVFLAIPPKYLETKLHEAPDYIIGQFIDWTSNGRFHTGTIESFNQVTGEYLVRSLLERDGVDYSDGDIRNKAFLLHYTEVAKWLSFPAIAADGADIY